MPYDSHALPASVNKQEQPKPVPARDLVMLRMFYYGQHSLTQIADHFKNFDQVAIDETEVSKRIKGVAHILMLQMYHIENRSFGEIADSLTGIGVETIDAERVCRRIRRATDNLIMDMAALRMYSDAGLIDEAGVLAVERTGDPQKRAIIIECEREIAHEFGEGILSITRASVRRALLIREAFPLLAGRAQKEIGDWAWEETLSRRLGISGLAKPNRSPLRPSVEPMKLGAAA